MGYRGNTNEMVGTWVMVCVTILAITLVWVFIAAWIGAWIWNYIVVSKFGVPEMSYFDMFLLMVLARLVLPINVNNKGS